MIDLIPAPVELISVIGGIVGGILSVGSSLIQKNANERANKLNALENEKDRVFNSREAALARQHQQALIDQQNEYNSFANQRKLAEAAGLNPYRLFDSGAAGIATSSASTNAAQASGSTSRSFIPTFDPSAAAQMSQAAVNVAQAGLMKKQGQLVDAQTGQTDASTRLVQTQADIEGIRKRIFANYGEFQAKLDMKESEARIAFNNAQTSLVQTSNALAKYNLENLSPAQLGNIIADTQVKWSQSYYNDSLRFKTDQDREQAAKLFGLQTALVASQVAHNYASAYAARQQGYQSGVMGALYDGKGTPGFEQMRASAYEQRERSVFVGNIYRRTLESTIESIKSQNEHSARWSSSRGVDGQGGFWLNTARWINDFLDRMPYLGSPHGSQPFRSW